MSFDTTCPGCGAHSGPSVGVCPFCKTILSSSSERSDPSVEAFIKLHRDGQLERALASGTILYKMKSELKTDLNFALHFAMVLLEAEAPSIQLRSFLAEAQFANPKSSDLVDLATIVEVRSQSKDNQNKECLAPLREIIHRSPQNYLAYFFLGSNLFWGSNDTTEAIPYLETCVRLNPVFLRAWGCLGAIYKKLGNEQLARAAFQKCVGLETNANMKSYFQSQLQ